MSAALTDIVSFPKQLFVRLLTLYSFDLMLSETLH
jgi:hypothetical protein